jgi:predicted Fe-Mo cluster-binding NifX family protein
MKVAITAKGADLSSEVDPRFGRAAKIIIVELETMEVETIDNSTNANSFKGAGIQAATMIHERGAHVLMTGYCGPKAFQTLQAAGIRVVSDVSGTVGKALERFKSGEIEYLESANVESHW